MGNATPKAAEYRRKAAACLGLAAKAQDPTDRAELVEMARVWHKLADNELQDDSAPIAPLEQEAVLEPQRSQRSDKNRDRSN